KDIDAVRIELAGRLLVADVETVYQAWQGEAWNDPLKPVIIDITLITAADEHGRTLLAVMHRFGAQIIAKSRESSAIVQRFETNSVASGVSKPGWFGGLIRFFRNGRHTEATVPLHAELISRIWARQALRNVGDEGTGEPELLLTAGR